MTFDPSSLHGAARITYDQLTVSSLGDASVALSGEIAARDPVSEIGPHLRAVHDAARGCGTLEVDLTGLHFVNSSALRLFMEWIAWIASEPPDARYRLTFVTDRSILWQRASLPAIMAMSGGILTLRPSAPTG